MKKFLSIFIAILIMVSFMGCNRTYMTINGEEISMSEFKKEKNFVFPKSENNKEVVPDYISEQQDYEIQQRLIFKSVVKNLAKENGIESTDEEIEQYVTFYAKCGQKLPDLELANAIFKVRFNKSFDLLLEDAKLNSMVYKVFRKQLGESVKVPTEEEIEKIYNDQSEYFKIPEAYYAIKVSIEKNRKTEKEPEKADWTLEEIEDIRKDVTSEKKAYSAIKKYTKNYSKDSDTKNLFYIGQGNIKVDEALSVSTENSCSGVVDEGSYWVFFWIAKKYEASIVGKAEVYIPLEDYLYVMNNQDVFREFNNNFSQADVIYNERDRLTTIENKKAEKEAAKKAKQNKGGEANGEAEYEHLDLDEGHVHSEDCNH